MIRYLLLTACLLVFYSLSFAQNDSISSVSKNTGSASAIKEVEYKGHKDLNHFISDNLNSEVKKYIRKNNLQNKMYAQMDINTKGEVSDVTIPGEQDFFVSNELIRVLKLTRWDPATKNGIPMHRKILVPLAFSF